MKKLLAGSALAVIAMSGAAAAQEGTSACLITKTETNPFFVKMREGAEAKAAELGITLNAYAGREDGDHESQVQAIETCIANGASGILIAASDTAAIVDSVQAARDAGLLVIALDTPLNPIDAADATFATDNFQAGLLIGQWAAATLGDATADAKIAFLDLDVSQPTVDVLRDQGFMQGFGIDTKDAAVIGDEDDPRIVGHDVTQGNEEGGRRAMENLLATNPDINVVYTINEPSAAGAYQALQAIGRESDVLIVSVDGGCPGVQNVQDGVIGATSQQYPLQMAALGVEAIAQFAADGTLPEPTEGKDFYDTGVALVTGAPVDGVESISVEEGLELCWG
ncbi:sugar ABC transporter substrate-binding protein [Rubellimicrobium rubrum]|uniref:Sugar ABC transporter substrate-binding protein n=1 Tax=Rubellimicrobium rubrum TaxID=2585369 RepID=A0A5C4N1G7_9RHOB|nr:sugar ABC transporter substrate-binding protein [Rubellimicrobium rubrum]TNC50699.1 sugar ABC transporter substrate-binding protein [Rubellimicrobium rubrum]